jgi:hypothetical protein
MSQEQVARDLAYHLKQEYEREFIAAKKAVLHTEVKKIAAPEMWERLAIWLEKTVELANECLGESGLAYDRRANKMTISTTLGRAKSIVVKFNPSTGRISYGAPGQNLDRVKPVINGAGFAYRTRSNDLTTEEEIGSAILKLLR